VNGPGTVIFTMRSVFARRELQIVDLDRMPAPDLADDARQPGFGWPERSSALPGLSRSTPSSAVAKRFE